MVPNLKETLEKRKRIFGNLYRLYIIILFILLILIFIQDTDADKITDGDEFLIYHTNIFSADSDGDGLNDYLEINKYHTDPNNADSDYDGYSDGEEVRCHSIPNNPEIVPILKLNNCK